MFLVIQIAVVRADLVLFSGVFPIYPATQHIALSINPTENSVAVVYTNKSSNSLVFTICESDYGCLTTREGVVDAQSGDKEWPTLVFVDSVSFFVAFAASRNSYSLATINCILSNTSAACFAPMFVWSPDIQTGVDAVSGLTQQNSAIFASTWRFRNSALLYLCNNKNCSTGIKQPLPIGNGACSISSYNGFPVIALTALNNSGLLLVCNTIQCNSFSSWNFFTEAGEKGVVVINSTAYIGFSSRGILHLSRCSLQNQNQACLSQPLTQATSNATTIGYSVSVDSVPKTTGICITYQNTTGHVNTMFLLCDTAESFCGESTALIVTSGFVGITQGRVRTAMTTTGILHVSFVSNSVLDVPLLHVVVNATKAIEELATKNSVVSPTPTTEVCCV